MQKTVK